MFFRLTRFPSSLFICVIAAYIALFWIKFWLSMKKILQIFCWPSLVSVIVIGAYWRMMITSILQLWHSHLFLQKSQNVCLCSSSQSSEMAYGFEKTAFIKPSYSFFPSTFPSHQMTFCKLIRVISNNSN